MKLGLDIDGVVGDMAQSLIDHINEKYNLSHTVEIFKYHKLARNVYVPDKSLNEEIVKSMYDNVVRDTEGILNVELYDGVLDVLYKLRKAGHTLHYITSRWEGVRDCTIKWFRDNNIPFDSIHVIGRSDKGRVGRSLNLDFYIDDQVDNLENMYRYKHRWRKGLCLYERPWNRIEKIDRSKFMSTDNWNTVIRHLGIHNR